jgi:hypothetical protein
MQLFIYLKYDYSYIDIEIVHFNIITTISINPFIVSYISNKFRDVFICQY